MGIVTRNDTLTSEDARIGVITTARSIAIELEKLARDFAEIDRASIARLAGRINDLACLATAYDILRARERNNER